MDGNATSHDLLARRVLESAPVVILVLALDGTIQHINPYFEKLVGRRLDEVRGKDWFDTFLPDRDRERIRMLFRRSTAGEHVRGIVNVVVTATGEERHIEWTDETLRDDDGRETGVLAIGQDVTERTTAELRYRSLIAAMHDGVVVQSAAGEIVECNPAAERMLGLSADQMAGRTSMDPRWRSVREDGSPFPGEEHPGPLTLSTGKPVTDVVMGVHHTDGRLNWLLINAVPFLRASDGAVIGNVASFSDITERKRLEERLWHAHRIASIGAWELDLEASALWWSEEQCRVHGVPVGTAVDRTAYLSLVHPDDREDVQRGFETAMKTGSWEAEYRIVRCDGQVRTLYGRAETTFDGLGKPLSMAGTNQDITDRKNAEDAARRSAELLRTVVGGAPVVLFALDLQGVFKVSDGRGLEALGLRPGQMVGASALEVYGGVPGFEEAFRRARSGERMSLASRVGRTAFEAVYAPSYRVDGAIDGVIGVAFDVTDRVAAEAALRDREARLAVVFDHTSDAMLLLSAHVDGSLRVAAANSAFLARSRRVGGVEEASLLGMTFDELMRDVYKRGAEVVRYQALLRGVLDSQVPTTFDLAIETGGGTMFAETTLVPVVDAAGSCAYILWTSRDVSAKRLAEAQMRASLAEKETLLREIHHRVKNNLQMVASLLHFHAKRFSEPRDVAAFAELRERIVAMVLVHERLYQSSDVARIDFGGYLSALVTELMRSSRAKEGIRIDVTAEDLRLPIELALPGGMIVCELVTNVLKYAFPDAQKGTATVRVRVADGLVLLDVDDDGVGFPDGFDSRSGSSFGWELVRTLALQLDGAVAATSDHGAHVRVSFPIARGPVVPS